MRKKITTTEPWYNKSIEYTEKDFIVYSFNNGDFVEIEKPGDIFITLTKSEIEKLEEIFADIRKESKVVEYDN